MKSNINKINLTTKDILNLSKKDLLEVCENSPHALNEIAAAASKGYPDALNAISEQLKAFSKEELVGIFENSPHTLNHIVFASYKGNPDALNAISEQLKAFSKEKLVGIFKNSQHTLNNIASVAGEGSPDALNSISEQLKAFSKEELVGIFKNSPHALSNIALSAYKGNPDALNAISEQLKAFTKVELCMCGFKNSPHTLSHIALSAYKGNPNAPDALNAISEQLKAFSKEELVGIFKNSRHTLSDIAFAAAKGNPGVLNSISEQLKAFSKEELVGIFKNSHHTLNEIAFVACQYDNPDALNAISEQLKSFSVKELEGVFKNNPNALHEIAFVAFKGNPDALNAISEQLKHFSKEDLVGIFEAKPEALSSIVKVALKGNSVALESISLALSKNKREFCDSIKRNKVLCHFLCDINVIKNIRLPNFENLLCDLEDRNVPDLTISDRKNHKLLKQKSKILISSCANGYRYKSNIKEVERFLDETDSEYQDLRELYPNLLIDHLIAQWNEYSDSETPDKDIYCEIKELINLLSQQEVGYYTPNGNLKIRDLANYLSLQMNQYNYLDPSPSFLKEAYLRLYCESFIKFCQKSDDICNILSIDKDNIIKEHLSLILSNDKCSLEEIKFFVDKVYESPIGDNIKNGDISIETMLQISDSYQKEVGHEYGSNKRSCSTAFMSSSSYSGQDLNGPSEKKCKTEKTENSFR